MLFVYDEAKEFVHDVKCIKTLIDLCNKYGIDTNLYYELNYYAHKLKNWKNIKSELIKEQANSLLSAIEVLLLTVSEDKAKELLSGKVNTDLTAFDKLKYANTKGFKGKLGVTRTIYPEGFEEKFDDYMLKFLLVTVFSPLWSILVYLVLYIGLIGLTPSEYDLQMISLKYNNFLFGICIFVYIIIFAHSFWKFMSNVGIDKILYLYAYKHNTIANLHYDERYTFQYTRAPRRVEEITDRVMRARYMLQNESCLQSLLYTYNYYVESYLSEESRLYVILPGDSKLDAKFFFDIYAKAEFELDKYLKEVCINKQKNIFTDSLSVEQMVNEYLATYKDYIN